MTVLIFIFKITLL